jgi:hypothetical protein
MMCCPGIKMLWLVMIQNEVVSWSMLAKDGKSKSKEAKKFPLGIELAPEKWKEHNRVVWL